MKNTRKLTRYIPEGYIQYKPQLNYPENMFACYVTRDDSDPRAIFFTGKQSKPTWHFRFMNLTNMKDRIHTTIKNLMAHEDRKEQNKALRNKGSDLKVGDVLFSSWGYDQTNVDFYQVTETIGKRTVVIQPIKGSIVDSNGHTDFVSAVKDSFIEKPMKKLVKDGNTVRLNSYSSAWIWDGRPRSQTAFGYGH